jgi:hypothetical protein
MMVNAPSVHPKKFRLIHDKTGIPILIVTEIKNFRLSLLYQQAGKKPPLFTGIII